MAASKNIFQDFGLGERLGISRQSLAFGASVIFTIAVYGPMAMMSIGAGVVVFAWLLALLLQPKANEFEVVRATPLFWPTLFLGFACLFSLVWASVTHVVFVGVPVEVHWLKDTKKIWHLFFPLCFFHLLTFLPFDKLKKLTLLWLGLGLASAILGVVQHYVPVYHALRLPHVGYHNYTDGVGWTALLRGHYHATGMTAFHLTYASLIAFPGAVFLVFALDSLRRRRTAWKKRLLFLAAFLLFFAANHLSFSKIAWAALPLTVLFAVVALLKGKSRYAIVALLVVFATLWVSSDEFRYRFQGSDTIRDRMQVWQVNWAMVKSNWLFGVGWQKNSEVVYGWYVQHVVKGFDSHAHNNVLDQWASTGTVGLLAFVLWNLTAVVLALKVYRGCPSPYWASLSLGFALGWLCFHLNGLTQCNWWDAKLLHQTGWVTAVTLDLYRRKTGKLEQKLLGRH